LEHGDVDGAERLLRELADADEQVFAEKGRHAEAAMRASFSKQQLAGKFCDVIEDLMR
jgi:hypothetical protein